MKKTTVLCLAAIAGSSFAQVVAPTYLYAPARSIKSQKISLEGWGSGTIAETDGIAYEGMTSIRVSTRNFFQGGIVNFGQEDIGNLYRAVTEDKPNLIGTFRMILSNLLIDIDGDKATARAMWTQTINESIKGPPRFIEQGWEVDALQKIDGKWKITKRVVTADSNLPDMMDDTYTPRPDYKL